MITFIYSLIIFVACTIGAIVGIGGGVIIKPALDMIGIHSVEVIGFISTCAVFAMSISSSIKHIRNKTPMKASIVCLVSAGSLVGGIVGDELFNRVRAVFSSDKIKAVQAVIILAFIIFVIIYVNKKNKKSFQLKNPVMIILTGLVLGLLSAFLGIGGGPINTAFLTLLFSFSVKESSVYSVAIIFFSQLSQLTKIAINNITIAGGQLELSPLMQTYMQTLPIVATGVCVAIVGGIIGAKINIKISDKAVTRLFSVVLVIVALINIYNAITGVLAQ